MIGLLVVIGFILLFGTLFLYAVRSQQQIDQRKRESASRLGFTPIPEPPVEISQRIIGLYENSHHKRFKLKNFWRKNFPDGEIYLFDLKETSGEDDTVLADQGLLFVSRYLNLPRFSLFPRLDMDGKLADLANRFVSWAYSRQGNQIDLSDHPDFDRRYIVIGEDCTMIREFMDDSRLERLANTQGCSLQAGGDAFSFSLSNFSNRQANKGSVSQQDLAASIHLGMQLYSWLSTSAHQENEYEYLTSDASSLTHCSQCGAPLSSASDGSRIAACRYCGSPVGAPRQARTAALLDSPNDTHDWSIQSNEEWVKQGSKKKGSQTIQLIKQTGCTMPFALFWTAFSAIFLVVGVMTYLNERQTFDLLTREGIRSVGIVTDLSLSSDSDGDDTFYVRYRYTVPVSGDAVSLSNRQSVPESLYNWLENGMKVEILYAASQPSISELRSTFGPPDLMLPFCFGGMGLLFTLIGLGMIVGALASIGRALTKKAK